MSLARPAALMKATTERNYTRLLSTLMLSARDGDHLEHRPRHFGCHCLNHLTCRRNPASRPTTFVNTVPRDMVQRAMRAGAPIELGPERT